MSCVPIEVDGETVLVQLAGTESLTEEECDILVELVRAARKRAARECHQCLDSESCCMEHGTHRIWRRT